MPKKRQLSVVSSGIDWFTCTAGIDEVGEDLYKRGSYLVGQFVDRGDKVKNASWQGYRGEQAGPIMYGLRGDSVVLRASGVGAQDAFEAVRGLAVKPTRVDVQMTVLHGSVRTLPDKLRKDAMRARAGRQGTPYRVRRIDGCGDGDAILIGDRSSEAFGRSYDKYRETLQKYKESVALRRELAEGFPDGSWRYEVEYKGSKALSVYERLLEGDFERVVVGDVRGWYEDHGINIPIGDGMLPAVREAKYVPDDERSLAWISSTVRPTVDHLVARGRLGDVLEASGLCAQLRELDVDELFKLLGLV